MTSGTRSDFVKHHRKSYRKNALKWHDNQKVLYTNLIIKKATVKGNLIITEGEQEGVFHCPWVSKGAPVTLGR